MESKCWWKYFIHWSIHATLMLSTCKDGMRHCLKGNLHWSRSSSQYFKLWRKSWKSRFPPNKKTRKGSKFWSNKQFKSIFLLISSISFTYLCRFIHQNKIFFNFSIFGKPRFSPKTFYNIDDRLESSKRHQNEGPNREKDWSWVWSIRPKNWSLYWKNEDLPGWKACLSSCSKRRKFSLSDSWSVLPYSYGWPHSTGDSQKTSYLKSVSNRSR